MNQNCVIGSSWQSKLVGNLVILLLIIFVAISARMIPYGTLLLEVELLVTVTGGVFGVLMYLLRAKVFEAHRKPAFSY